MTDDKYNPKNVKLSGLQWLLLAGLGFLSGMIIGQAIDNAYPINGLLHYNNPYFTVPSLGLEFVWWIPILYGIAGALIVVLIILLNKLLNKETGAESWLRQKPRGGYNPSWGFTIASIIVFVIQWFGGCYLATIFPNSWMFAILLTWGLLIWWVFDGTDAGIILCLFVATLGPLIEFILINYVGLYYYTNPDAFGVPFWFVGHYIGGTPANMNLGRKYLAFLNEQEI